MGPDWLGLTGRVCVVTGGGGGLGRGIVDALAQVGAIVVVLDLSGERAEEAVSAIRASDGRSSSIACDVSDFSSVQSAAEACVRTHGRCDVLVNNAALLRPGSLARLSLEDWNDLIAVNLTGYFLCAQAFGNGMRAQRSGSIVHVASISAFTPQPFGGAYSVSKAGVLMLSRNIAQEWGEHGVRSNVVSPGMVRTPLTEPIYRDPAVLAQREAIVPLGRIGTAADIADAVVFLASDRAEYISGEEILVDGGLQHTTLALIPRPGFDRTSAEAVETG